ncbi:hypothetical protein B296_00000655 [Ensete ventricosum]|uniref:Uncharacterized protein n=1 Tax=Ensete ventricosum TaxID=4639 RepID=A0A426Z4S1_ENSVE|nr:hypothetical protein B296_00000655 [Ensete ventricosum]
MKYNSRRQAKSSNLCLLNSREWAKLSTPILLTRGGGVKPSIRTFSTTKRIGEVEYPSSLTYPVEELCISSVTLQRKLLEDNSCQILAIGD